MIEFTKKFLAKYMHKILFGIIAVITIGVGEKYFYDQFWYIIGGLAILAGVWGTLVGQTFWYSDGVKPPNFQSYNWVSIVAGVLSILLGFLVF